MGIGSSSDGSNLVGATAPRIAAAVAGSGADASLNHLFLGTHGPWHAPFLSCHAFSRFLPAPQRWRTVVIAGAVTARSFGAAGVACNGAASPIRPARAIV